MDGPRDLKAIGDLLPSLLAGLGIGRLDVMLRLSSEWEELVDDPWKTHTVPQILRDGELIVEAKNAAAVRMLRYGTAALVEHLTAEFGPDVIRSVEVVSPGRQ
jgi:hypothetical protein